MAREGTFVLADIGGYTHYLSGVGIQHAKETIEHLLNRLIATKHRQWKVANVMGDCVFFYGDPEPPHETFGRLRSLYESFREAKLDIASGSTCRCGACDRTEDLSLKFVVHAGEYDVQNIGGRRELIGSDIVLATRLLKNSVPVKEYIIATEPASALVEAAGNGGAPGRDDLEGIGPVDYSYIDLAAMAEEYDHARAFYLSQADARLAVTADIDAPIDVVWPALLDVDKRAVWQVTVTNMMHIQGPRAGIGEVHSCLHRGSEIVHAAVAVDPENHRKTERVWIPQPIVKDIYVTWQATPLPGNRTQVAFYATFKPRIRVLSTLATPLFSYMIKRETKKDLAGLKEFCETGKVAARDSRATAA